VGASGSAAPGIGSPGGADLELVAGGRTLRFPAVWLRDNCPCPQCVAPGTGQKLNDITDLPDGLAVAGTEDHGGSVVVTFAPDGHRSAFARSWLAGHELDHGEGGDGRTEDDKVLWLAADLAPGRFPEASWPRYLDQPEVRLRALDAVLRMGFVLLRDVPAEPGRVLEVAASFGFVRETNYGRLFDVRVEPAPGNLAFTSRAIRPHTDNPYRDPVPTVQLLHCLRAAGEGGDTGLVDGFAAAAAFRASDPESFGILAKTPVPFGYVDKETELRASLPLIQLSPRGRVRGVRFNNRSARPLRLPYAEVTAFYPAYRRWAWLLAEPGRQLNLRAGDRVRGAAVRRQRGGGAPLGRRGQGPLRHPARIRALRAAAHQPAQVPGVRDSALTAVELRTLNATAPPR
jgi:gamma-butyrobetaine dioxygenase